jgi:YfiH family protein
MEGEPGLTGPRFVTGAEGALAVESPLLRASSGVVHAFSTRLGGVSLTPFASLNLGISVGDDRAAVEENRRRFFGSYGIEPAKVVRARQVHGDGVLRVDGPLLRHPGFPQFLLEEGVGYDALITDLRDRALVVSTADCLPILIHDPVREAVAAVHAGWRGTARRVAARAVAAMTDAYGTDPRDCVVAMGPAIRRCCFEVDVPVAEAMAAALPTWHEHAIAIRPGHFLLDLVGVNRAILQDAGVQAAQIDDVSVCTGCRTDAFFSHRAEKGRTGRMMNFILLKGDSDRDRDTIRQVPSLADRCRNSLSNVAQGRGSC